MRVWTWAGKVTTRGIGSNGEDVLISGFGKFLVNEKAARKGRNPVTGET
jgi:nucleoid DNA-binding protein